MYLYIAACVCVAQQLKWSCEHPRLPVDIELGASPSSSLSPFRASRFSLSLSPHPGAFVFLFLSVCFQFNSVPFFLFQFSWLCSAPVCSLVRRSLFLLLLSELHKRSLSQPTLSLSLSLYQFVVITTSFSLSVYYVCMFINKVRS